MKPGVPLRRQQTGVVMIEMAIALPLLLLFLFGTINYGVAFYNKSVISNASREAARTGVIFRIPSRPSSSEIRSVAESYRNNLISFDSTSFSSFDVTVDKNGVPASGQTLTVTVRYRFGGVVGNLVPGMKNGLWLTSSTAMTYE